MIILSTPQFDKEAKALLKKHPSLPNDLEFLFESLQANLCKVLRLVTIAIKYVWLLNHKVKVNQVVQGLLLM